MDDQRDYEEEAAVRAEYEREMLEEHAACGFCGKLGHTADEHAQPPNREG